MGSLHCINLPKNVVASYEGEKENIPKRKKEEKDLAKSRLFQYNNTYVEEAHGVFQALRRLVKNRRASKKSIINSRENGGTI